MLAAGTLYVLGVTIGLPLLALGSGSIDNPDTTICPLTPTAAAGGGSPTILGPPTLTVGDLTRWWDDTRRSQPTRLAMPIDDVIALYLSEGDAEGVRGDLAFAQAVHETGYFTSSDTARNNFAGIAHYDHADTGRTLPGPAHRRPRPHPAPQEVRRRQRRTARPRRRRTRRQRPATTWGQLARHLGHSTRLLDQDLRPPPLNGHRHAAATTRTRPPPPTNAPPRSPAGPAGSALRR